jgi:hypothetical protein
MIQMLEGLHEVGGHGIGVAIVTVLIKQVPLICPGDLTQMWPRPQLTSN